MNLLWLFLAIFSLLALSDGRPFDDIRSLLRRVDKPDYWGSAHRPDELDFGKKDVTVVLRADSRSPEEIKKAGGFFARPGPDTTSRYNLFNHIMGNLENTAYVSTTEELSVAAAYARNIKLHPNNKEKKAYIYKIQTSARFIDMNRSMRIMKGSSGVEHVAMVGIPFSDIISSTEATDAVLENPGSAQFEDNSAFKPRSKTGSTIRPELAVFPPSHPAWKAKPWSTYKKPVDLVKKFGEVLDTVQENPPREAHTSAAEDKARSKRARKVRQRKVKSQQHKPRPAADNEGATGGREDPPEDDHQDDESTASESTRRLKDKNRKKPNKGPSASEPPEDSGDDGSSAAGANRTKAQKAKDWIRKKLRKQKTKPKPSRPTSSGSSGSDTLHKPWSKPGRKPGHGHGKL
ncbi:Heat-labile enterotoxin IIB, A chain [Cordyceps javanica]|uniref:Heat-labile enterotoxin IIB, A chain n=1 Tax=Cordyceps javanica TaxID=43265 RepID=A0A545UR86_9HYPO|nr:Heat-labile enterotoxin IIB, A chain [Cordyceps javanica]TQW03916.1 heat-labile enterotoxin IIB, A chain [Cordyceps javanica]